MGGSSEGTDTMSAPTDESPAVGEPSGSGSESSAFCSQTNARFTHEVQSMTVWVACRKCAQLGRSRLRPLTLEVALRLVAPVRTARGGGSCLVAPPRAHRTQELQVRPARSGCLFAFELTWPPEGQRRADWVGLRDRAWQCPPQAKLSVAQKLHLHRNTSPTSRTS